MREEPEPIVRALFLTPEGRRHPYPLYHRLRETAPVHWSSTLGAWLLTRYADCCAVLHDPRLRKNFAGTMERASSARTRPDISP